MRHYIWIHSWSEIWKPFHKKIFGELQEDANKHSQKLINNVVLRFDLSPKEAEFLTEFYRKGKIEGH